MTTEEMVEELVQFYEAAGFSDYYERELKGKSDAEVAGLYAAYLKAQREDQARAGY
jgi:hypothetical protein